VADLFIVQPGGLKACCSLKALQTELINESARYNLWPSSFIIFFLLQRIFWSQKPVLLFGCSGDAPFIYVLLLSNPLAEQPD
jgi:hypothetical protein